MNPDKLTENTRAALEEAGQALYSAGYHDGFLDGHLVAEGRDSYPDAEEEADIFRKADSENEFDGWMNHRDSFLSALPSSLVPVEGARAYAKRVTMPNGDVLQRDEFMKSWDITGPSGACAGGEQDWELVERYGLDALLAAGLFVVPVEGGWRPIETAPDDGSRILVCFAGDDERDVEIRGADGHWWRLIKVGPTHWMPLPTPPRAL